MVLPEPVADTIVPRAPCGGTDDLAGNPTHFLNADRCATWCSLSGIADISMPPRAVNSYSASKRRVRNAGRTEVVPERCIGPVPAVRLSVLERRLVVRVVVPGIERADHDIPLRVPRPRRAQTAGLTQRLQHPAPRRGVRMGAGSTTSRTNISSRTMSARSRCLTSAMCTASSAAPADRPPRRDHSRSAMPTRASLTTLTLASQPSANSGPREAGVMPPSSTTWHCAPVTAPASSAAARSSASLAGTPCASPSANTRSRAFTAAVWYCVTRSAESLLSKSCRFVVTGHYGRSSRNPRADFQAIEVSRVFANSTCCIDLMLQSSRGVSGLGGSGEAMGPRWFARLRGFQCAARAARSICPAMG